MPPENLPDGPIFRRKPPGLFITNSCCLARCRVHATCRG